MTEVKFLALVKKLVADYTNEHLDRSDAISIKTSDVYVVWYCKTLKNCKALASTILPDGMYYEITYNGQDDEYYLDAYKKFENRKVKLL